MLGSDFPRKLLLGPSLFEPMPVRSDLLHWPTVYMKCPRCRAGFKNRRSLFEPVPARSDLLIWLTVEKKCPRSRAGLKNRRIGPMTVP